MSTNVIVTGLPGDSKFPKLVYTFKNIFKKIQIKKFWIRELGDLYDSDFKQMTIEFPNTSDARKARNYLDNLTYTQGQGNYMLMATLDDESMPPEEYHDEERNWRRNRRPGKRGRARSRSPSPRYAREANKLDMEIELLRKQRQVIEEERRLLVEQKKLEMIREYGPSASRDFDRFEAPRKRQQPPEPVQVKPKRKRSSPPPPPKANGAPGLPQFFQPCKKLIADMKQYIETDTTPEEVEILIRLIRASIRKNLAIALDGKDYMPTGEIMRLYRELHPKTTDAAFVAKILSNIRASYLPSKIRIKPDPDALEGKGDGNEVGNDGKMEMKAEKDLKKTGSEKEPPAANEVGIDGAVGKEVEKDSVEKTGNKETQPDANGVGSGNTEKVEKDENQSEGAKVQESCEDNKAANETEPHEKPVNEENGTDLAPNAGVAVKCEPDLPQETPEKISAEEASDINAEPLSDRGEVTGAVSTISEDLAPMAGVAVKCEPDLPQETPEKISAEVASEINAEPLSDRGEVTGAVGTLNKDLAPNAGVAVKCEPDLPQETPEKISAEVASEINAEPLSDRGEVTGAVGTLNKEVADAGEQ